MTPGIFYPLPAPVSKPDIPLTLFFNPKIQNHGDEKTRLLGNAQGCNHHRREKCPSIIAAVALWLITIWIPYLNIGTTIAITLLPTQLAKGEIINPLGIFDAKYRRYWVNSSSPWG